MSDLIRHFLFLWVSLIVSCAKDMTDRENLGNGYFVKIESEQSSSSVFEGAVHFRVLMDGKKRVSKINSSCFISPSGNFVLYGKGDSIYIYKRNQYRVKLVFINAKSKIGKVDWKEAEGVVSFGVNNKREEVSLR